MNHFLPAALNQTAALRFPGFTFWALSNNPVYMKLQQLWKFDSLFYSHCCTNLIWHVWVKTPSLNCKMQQNEPPLSLHVGTCGKYTCFGKCGFREPSGALTDVLADVRTSAGRAPAAVCLNPGLGCRSHRLQGWTEYHRGARALASSSALTFANLHSWLCVCCEHDSARGGSHMTNSCMDEICSQCKLLTHDFCSL